MKPSIVAVAGLIVTACITAPADVGHGIYGQVFTPQQQLVGQSTFETAVQCEMDVRSSWAKLSAMGLTARCTSQDRSRELPFSITVTSSIPGMPVESRYESAKACANGIDWYRKQGGITYAPHC